MPPPPEATEKGISNREMIQNVLGKNLPASLALFVCHVYQTQISIAIRFSVGKSFSFSKMFCQ